MLHPSSRELFPFERDVTYLNHGGFGVTPLEVMAARIKKLHAVEAAPGPFFAYDDRPAWRATVAQVA